MSGDWQNLSIWVSESVILGGSRVTDEVTILRSTAENTEFLSRRTSDFRHLGLWPLECDSYKRVGHPTKPVKRRRGQFKCGNKRASH
jgi:hypothetical protein